MRKKYIKICDFVCEMLIFTHLYVKYTGTNCRYESKERSRKTGKFLARATGLEPVTYGLKISTAGT